MNRFNQNFMYIIISIFIFFACIYFFTFDQSYEVKGIYLPKPEIDIKKTKIDDLNNQSNIIKCIGIIRSSIYTQNKIDYEKLCHKNLKNAVKIASSNGANKIKYICSYPKGKIDQLSSVSLTASVFKETDS